MSLAASKTKVADTISMSVTVISAAGDVSELAIHMIARYVMTSMMRVFMS